MRIEAHNKFGKPLVAEITRLVVYDAMDNPILVALDPGDGSIIAATAEQHSREFHSILQAFGIQKTVIVKDLQQSPLSQMNFSKNG